MINAKRMISKVFYSTVLLIALGILASCGFHLRNHQSRLNTQYPVIVLPLTSSHTFHQALRRSLLTSSIRVVDISNNPQVPQLRVVSELLTAQPLVYGPDSELRRERLKMTVGFTFGTNEPKVFELSTERDRQLNSRQHLADNAEKVLIEQEMQSDIIHQLSRYLATTSF